MLIERPAKLERYGSIRLYDVVRVTALDGLGFRGSRPNLVHVDEETALDIASRMAFVVPVKDEDIFTLEGVLSGIPHASRVIIVSASSREPVDRYSDEVRLAKIIHSITGRPLTIIHQNDPAWGEALKGTELEPLLDGNGSVRRGKGEGMVLGVIAAAALGADYIGFIDSDNYVPGAVNEYARAYIAGFSLADSPYTMIRIKWPFKAKPETGEIYLRKRGRVSMNTNMILNYAISLLRKIETDIVKTANSGEHALTTSMALKMLWAGGFAIEPYQLVFLLERCWLGLEDGLCPFTPEGVTIYQIETRNPHIHAERGDEHIVDMIVSSVATIYHSKLATEKLRDRIKFLLQNYDYDGDIPVPQVYPEPGRADPSKVFATYIAASNIAWTSD